MASTSLVVYGATGYSGRLIVQQALARGLRPLLAGRNHHALRDMADVHGLEWRAAAVDDRARVRALAAAAPVLLNAAGPFGSTAMPLIEACVAAGTHYLDITGEPGTIEATAERHRAAVRRHVMLMPAVGFEVVASDCLAAHVTRRLPRAATLRIGWDKSMTTSRGSLKTVLDLSGAGALVRRAGRLVAIPPGSLACTLDYGRGLQTSVAVGLGDVSAAFFSTGIPNIETYMRASWPIWSAVTATRYWGWWLTTPPWPAIMKSQIDLLPPGPSPQERCAGWATLVAVVTDAAGRSAAARMHTGDVYEFTARSAVAIAEQALGGHWQAGFQTPSRVYGADFAMRFDGTSREDV